RVRRQHVQTASHAADGQNDPRSFSRRYFSGLAASPLASESKDKIKDVLSSILGSAVQYGLLVKNPVEGIRLPAERRGKRKTKRHVTPEQFEQLLELIPEPYASMVFVAVWTGL